MTQTNTGITNKQILALRTEALIAGDYRQVDICDVALAAHETATEQGEDLTGPDGEPMTRSEARDLCADVIASAEAQS